MLFARGAGARGMQMLRRSAGLRVVPASEFDGAGKRGALPGGWGMLFDSLGAALVHGEPEQMRWLERWKQRSSRLIVPERRVRASGLIGAWLMPQSTSAAPPEGLTRWADSEEAGWGLVASGAHRSRHGGRGIRVAVLDTGLDFSHPDFRDRPVSAQSFVAGRSAQDENGHGTFCAGIACGPREPSCGIRYGVACEADLHIARVLDEHADGTDGDVLAGIDWAVRHHCEVISLSLGSPVALGDLYPQVYEEVAARALAAGSLLFSPAGNTSQRPQTLAPVEHPGNCPSVCAVAALDQRGAVASFSNAGLNPCGGDIECAAPGSAIRSAAPGPARYQLGSGTSIATPHVAGIAALHAGAHPQVRGPALRRLLRTTSLPLALPQRDAGSGLVQAPVS